MSTMNSEVYDALVDAGADETKGREAAKSVARYDSDLAEIKASLLAVKWIVGFVLAFVVAVTWPVSGSRRSGSRRRTQPPLPPPLPALPPVAKPKLQLRRMARPAIPSVTCGSGISAHRDAAPR